MRTEDVDVYRRSGRHGAGGAGDGVHQDRRLGDAQSSTAIFLRHGDTEPATLGYGAMELGGKFAAVVMRTPIIVAEAVADPLDAVADGELLVGQAEIHERPLGRQQPNRKVAMAVKV